MSSRSFVDLAYDLYANYWRDAKMNANDETNVGGEANAEPVTCNHNGQGDSLYHAVYVPPDDSGSNADAPTRVYRDKLEALKVMKNYKGARLKSFPSHEEAKEYALNGGEKEKLPTIQITNDEKSSNFKGPKPQELVAFRKMIESGDLEGVTNIVWENPRYLVSSGDTPAILQEGCRYNALHVVSAKGQTNASQMCELILNTVGNPEFVKLLYGEDDHKSYVDRAQILLDLYLNTPDKGLNETPLHFAAKYGLKDIVRVLVSYSECLRNLHNKYDQTPADVICSRKCQEDESLKREIHALLEDQYYVPVLRAEDNTMQPKIGDPFSPTSPQHPTKVDPISPRLEVRAFAGPMTKPMAFEFRKKWKTPPRHNLNFSQRKDTSLNDSFSNLFNHQDPCMRLNDTEKGLERIGRNLAEEYHVPWKEFWAFLNDFADFRCDQGLAKMEKYMETRFKDACQRQEFCKDQEKSRKSSANDLLNLCAKLESWSLQMQENSSDSDSDEEYYTPPSSPLGTIASSSSSSRDSICGEEMSLADEGVGTFIEGTSPSKTDFAVYDAIPEDIDRSVYPFTYRWRHEMQLFIENNNFDCNSTFSSTRRRLLETPEKPRKSKC